MLESKIKGLEYLTRAAVEEVVVNSNGQNELVRAAEPQRCARNAKAGMI
jgi:hypothetical protein